jgi:hypothetical protein
MFFFIEPWSFFARSFFWNSIFFLSQSHITGRELVKLTRVDSSFLLQHYIFWFFFVSSFDFKLLDLKLYNFFSFSFLRVILILYSWLRVNNVNLDLLKLSLFGCLFLPYKTFDLTYGITQVTYLVIPNCD